MEEEKQLTPKQAQFCREYLVDLNATQAAIRAGYSEHTANEIGSENLAKPSIDAVITRMKRDRAQRTQIDADRVISQIARLAFSDVRQLFTDTDGFKRISELDDDTAAAIQSVKVTRRARGKDENGVMQYDDVIEYKLADKKHALEMLAKHLGELKDTVDVNHKGLEFAGDILYTKKADKPR